MPLPGLPETKDKFWQNSNTDLIETKDLRNVLCTKHSFDLVKDSRELKCAKCGFTSKFTPSTISIDEKEKTVEIRGTKHSINF